MTIATILIAAVCGVGGGFRGDCPLRFPQFATKYRIFK